METQPFSSPQRQSVTGIIIIFAGTLYKIFRMFWAVVLYFIIQQSTPFSVLYAIIPTIVVALAIVHSYISYRNFRFHIDYEKDEFVLTKGVFSTDYIAILFDKIQQVNFERGILERIIGVYSLVIDTAGSDQKEIKIHAIEKEKAEELSVILLSKKEEQQNNTGAADSEDIPKVDNTEWTYRLSIGRLLKIGISSNFLRGFGLIIAFLSTLYNEFSRLFFEREEDFLEEAGNIPLPLESFFLFVILSILVLLLSVFITVAEVFIKYYNLKLVQTSERLHLEMGLRTNTKVSLQPRRVQIVSIITNPLQKWLNIYETKITLAGSREKNSKSKISIPGLEEESAKRIKSFLYGKREEEQRAVFKPDIVDFFRRVNFGLIPLVISYIIPFSVEEVSVSEWLVFAVIYLFCMIFYNFRMYKSLKLTITEDFIIKSYGVWNLVEQTAEIYKLQSVSIKRPIWYRRRGLVNVSFHTAGGDISFRAVDEEILSYMNYTLFRIETSRKAWM
ncbi:PH domain-containing protein [Salegentibacter sp. F188]|uniref:PH domain-containing protein n=1 Tax=Autumnicola patrickiae TaxID=3075591 RepID=A0ABU3E3D4_9FLAO|nr:PH domain-containing protein [Salegentibacter sp. F188]MDT0689772.1 PH domain-containing protein [Salegentibacter sp. F188]